MQICTSMGGGIAYSPETGVEHVIQSGKLEEVRYTFWELEGST